MNRRSRNRSNDCFACPYGAFSNLLASLDNRLSRHACPRLDSLSNTPDEFVSLSCARACGCYIKGCFEATSCSEIG